MTLILNRRRDMDKDKRDVQILLTDADLQSFMHDNWAD